jgi:quinol monooxygenase YgiN
MISVTSELRAKSGEEAEVARISLELARSSLSDESGCRGFTVTRSRHDPRLFLLVERYADDDALAEHSRAPHFKDAFEALIQRLEEPPRLALFDELGA